MGKLLQFAQETRSPKEPVLEKIADDDAAERQRLRAQFYIYRAVNILNKLDERDERIGWLLEDCAERLREAW